MNPTILYHSTKRMLFNLLVSLGAVGIPLVLYSFEGTITKKVVACILLIAIFFVPYFIVNNLLYYRKLLSPSKEKEFNQMPMATRGKAIGDHLSGWF
jgi:membrane protein YdbS with pleckstrin-like domain